MFLRNRHPAARSHSLSRLVVGHQGLTSLQTWWMAKFTVPSVALAYFAAVTAQYKVVQYFRDGLNLALIRGLGGGDWMTALSYVQDEFAGLLPVIAAALGVMVVGGWLVRNTPRPSLRGWLAAGPYKCWLRLGDC